MARQFQTIQIQNRPYQVDDRRQLFRSVDDPKVIIPFDRTFVANHEVYIAFERATGKPYSGTVTRESFKDPALKIEVVPQRLVFPNDEQSTEVGWPRDPMINIYGTVFKLDYNARRLEEVGRPENIMSFDDMLLVRSDQLSFWYDQGKKTIFKGSVLELGNNPDIIKVQIQPFYRVVNLTPIKEDNMQTLMEIARSLKENSVPGSKADAVEKTAEAEHRKRKRRGI
ncbi:hypothetical protein [Parachryseolinea silvisoli]|uniref:hypothetical protein n=1 Tax=Parachryseolinea silvisoli TaxID=2873601 RepID=UPI002265ED4D|nr:hypothetical protein [Parachryseolinea silvisoli]MCD9015225.1 hypothetical protein [Parachryseolinea silvisoli]